MSSAVSGCYLQGAIIHDYDFDPIKSIIRLAEFYESPLPAELISNLHRGGQLLPADIQVLREALDIHDASVTTVDEMALWIRESIRALFDTDNEGPLAGDDQYAVQYVSGMDGMVFRFDNPYWGEMELDGCLMITVPSVPVWRLDQYTGPTSYQQIFSVLQKIGAPMLKVVPWADRLGELIATVEG